jgi:hypothetical protein
MPVGPDNPNFNNTTDEIMIVSIVMPETGLRAVVAMAFAATEVKKKEHQRQEEADENHESPAPGSEEANARIEVTISQEHVMEMSRPCARARGLPVPNAAAMPNDPITLGDLRSRSPQWRWHRRR